MSDAGSDNAKELTIETLDNIPQHEARERLAVRMAALAAAGGCSMDHVMDLMRPPPLLRGERQPIHHHTTRERAAVCDQRGCELETCSDRDNVRLPLLQSCPTEPCPLPFLGLHTRCHVRSPARSTRGRRARTLQLSADTLCNAPHSYVQHTDRPSWLSTHRLCTHSVGCVCV